VRYADDFVMGFQHHDDAERFLEELRERMRKFCLELHPEKTRLLEFGRFAAESRRRRGLRKPETFSFLGFTHICAKTRSGKFLLKRQTMAKRLRTKLSEVKAELLRRRHWNIIEQGAWLRGVVRGYYAYHAVPTNIHALGMFRSQVGWSWFLALRRRSQKDRTPWRKMLKRINAWLPRPKISHPWPELRFDAITRGKSPVR
jgi:hypothetical protein